MRVIAHAVRTLSLGMVALLGVGTLTAVAAPPAPPSIAKGNNWNVEPVAGGCRLTLRLDAPAPRVKDGTALIRKDYAVPNDDGTGPAIRSIDGFIEPGKTTGDLSVRILDENLKEPTETFTASLHHSNAPTPHLPLPLSATITDND